MNEFSRPPSFDFGAATLHGFNLPGGRSYLFRVAGWTALLVTILYVAFGLPILKAFAELFHNVMNMEYSLDGSDPDPKVVMDTLMPMFRSMGLFFLIAIFQMIIFAAAEAAIYRNIFHGEDTGLIPLRIGSDEWRVLGTRIVIGLILSGIYMGIYLVAAVIGFVVLGLANALESGFLGAIGRLLMFCLIIAAIAGFVWIAIRLSPTSAYSVRDRQFNPVASWNPMKGHVWPAIGSFLIVYVIGCFAISLFLSLVFLILFFSSGILKVLMQIETDANAVLDFSPILDHLISPGFLIPVILAIFISIFVTILWYGCIWSMWGYFAKTDAPVSPPE